MLKKVNNNHLYILIGIVFILNTILFNTINSSKAQWTGPSGTPGEDTVNILTSPMQSNLDVAGYDIKDVGSINTSGNINIKRDDGAYAALLIGHTGNVEAVTYFDAINGDFAGEDYGRIGQNNDGYMEYRLNPNSPDLSHKFFLGTTNVLNITEGRLESSGTICDGSGNCLGSSSFSGDSNFTDNITVNNTIQSGSGPLNVSANGWGMNFLIDTDGGSADWFTWKDNGVELMNLEGNTGNLTVSGVLNANSGIKVDGNTVIDGDGNIIGADSNADSLDGIDSGSFLRSDISDSYNGGTLRVQNSVGQDVTQSSSINGLQVFQSSAGSDALMSFHVGGDYALHFGLDGETNDLTVGGWSMGNNKYKVWHAGNDGSESGLDADAVDGLDVHTGRNHNANKIVRTDQHGYLQAGWINTPSGFASGNWNKIYASEDDYVRYITKDTLCNAVTGHGCGYDNTIANTDYCSGGNCGGNINVPAGDSYNKYCMWGSADSTYCIGMYSGQNFGGLNNNYAMTFTMNNEDSRGWLWRDNAHNSSQGAMSLTTSGNLTVGNKINAVGSISNYGAPQYPQGMSTHVLNTGYWYPLNNDSSQTMYLGINNPVDIRGYVRNSTGNFAVIDDTDLIGNLNITGLINSTKTDDTSVSSHGLVVLGPINGKNISIDQNEIMARENGSHSPLYLNWDTGGTVNIGHDLYVPDNSWGSSSDQSIGAPNDGWTNWTTMCPEGYYMVGIKQDWDYAGQNNVHVDKILCREL